MVRVYFKSGPSLPGPSLPGPSLLVPHLNLGAHLYMVPGGRFFLNTALIRDMQWYTDLFIRDVNELGDLVEDILCGIPLHICLLYIVYSIDNRPIYAIHEYLWNGD